jgi:predicted amidohydrolase YtcJ
MACAASTAAADLVVRNAKIITLDRDNSVAEAIAVNKGRIVFVGKNTDVSGRPVKCKLFLWSGSGM